MSEGDQLQLLEIRLRSLEKTEQDRAVREARQEERRSSDAADFARLHARLDKIDGHIGRIVWLVIAAIVGGFMTFLISGGMAGA